MYNQKSFLDTVFLLSFARYLILEFLIQIFLFSSDCLKIVAVGRICARIENVVDFPEIKSNSKEGNQLHRVTSVTQLWYSALHICQSSCLLNSPQIFLKLPTLDVPPYKIGCPALEDPQIQGVGGEEEEINGVEIYKIPGMCKDLTKTK